MPSSPPSPPSPPQPNPEAGADQARIPAHRKASDESAPKTDDVDEIAPLSGVDRSGLGQKGWAEVPEDRIGGHPELETARKSGPEGGLNGPQPTTEVKTGAAKQD